MSYYKNTKKVGKMFARLTTGGSNPAMAGSSSSATKKAKKAKKAKKNKDKGKTKETVERALPLIELSDRVSPASDVPIAPMTASYKYASVFSVVDIVPGIVVDVVAGVVFFHRWCPMFEEMEEIIDSRLRAVEDKLFATLDVSELQLFVESTVKGATNALIKKTIYPTQQELKEAVEDYLEENNYDFLQGFRNRKSKWDAYYEKNFYNPLLKTMFSKRGTLTTKIKDAIDSNAIPEEVHNWKQSAKTKAAYSKLFSPIVANDPEDTYISRILTKVFPKGEAKENLMAFEIGTILLNKGTFVISDDDSDSSSSSSSSSSTFTIFKSSNKSNQPEDKQDQTTPTPEDTEDQATVSETASVPKISNVQSEGAPETTQVQEEAEKSGTSTPEKHNALKSSEVQQETRVIIIIYYYDKN
ncbi:hypothetical protein C2G38_2218984 [Gigaspora rosea]|uniref:Uncharacterized protein n=1 Tax=Gigaspora rosea TaxID=44941 RepID=A0A397U5W6_9GLOM|nr:hypothetical protein C2G38_2218984 [Gigaspora rosea]